MEPGAQGAGHKAQGNCEKSEKGKKEIKVQKSEVRCQRTDGRRQMTSRIILKFEFRSLNSMPHASKTKDN